MPLAITTPPKIDQKIQPVSSLVTKGADGYDIITICDVDKNFLQLLCIYKNRIYYLVNPKSSSTSDAGYMIYYSDVTTNTITNTGLKMPVRNYGNLQLMVDPDRQHIYYVSYHDQVISIDLINATSTIIPGLSSFPQNFSLSPCGNFDDYGYLKVGPIWFDTANECIYCNKPNYRNYRSDTMSDIPVYKATSNHGNLPTFTQIATIPCGNTSASSGYYWNIHVMGVSGTVIRYLLYMNCTCSELDDAKGMRYWCYNEYDYAKKTYYFVDGNDKSGIEIDIYNTNKFLYVYVSPSRKTVLPVYYSLNSEDYRLGLSTQQIIDRTYIYNNYYLGHESYPLGGIYSNPEYNNCGPFKYEIRDTYDSSLRIWYSQKFEGMRGGGIISDQNKNGFYTVYKNQIIYITIVEEE